MKIYEKEETLHNLKKYDLQLNAYGEHHNAWICSWITYIAL